MQHQAPISPGYSGGPLINRCGAVVGVSNSHHKTDNGLSYAVLGSDLADLARANKIPVGVSTTVPLRPIPPPWSGRHSRACRKSRQCGRTFRLNRPTRIRPIPMRSRCSNRPTDCIDRGRHLVARASSSNIGDPGQRAGMLGLGLTLRPQLPRPPGRHGTPGRRRTGSDVVCQCSRRRRWRGSLAPGGAARALVKRGNRKRTRAFSSQVDPLGVAKMRPNKELEPRSDAIRTEMAPGAVPIRHW